ncbi:hypothetical protein OG429_27895 [Streptomyces sp. NBC_00190]|uniref:hypothetical protein n=1 Tax=Streptomyces sp. NBC_00190 TaxID=2903634 RepID=UPI002E2A0CF6|nr:hypothetical protein [Streptomyces sp. NBC_00190]
MESAPTRVVVRPSYAKWAAWLCCIGLIAGGVLIVLYVDRHRTLPDEVPLQLAGSWDRACRIIYGQSLWCPLPGGHREPFRRALRLDSFLFIPGYTLALLAVFGLGSCFLYRKVSRRFMLRGLAVTGVTAAADVCENILLYRALDGLGTGADGDWQKASWCALLKWALVGPVTVAALWIALTLAARILLFPRAAVKTAGTAPSGTPPLPRTPLVQKAHELANRGEPWDDPDIVTPPAAPHATTPVSEWPDPAVTAEPPDSAKERWRTRALQLPGRKPAEVGICVSGGGIRSASVTLGGLQALREGGVLAKARYLVSVSGGGYTSGAFQLALTDEQPAYLADARLATVRDVFAPGSPEEDHIRRHAKYLADSPREKLLAAGIILRGLCVSLGLLALAFVVVGVYLSAFYHRVPLTDLDRLRTDPAASFPSLSDQLHDELVTPLVALVALAAVVSVVASLVRGREGKSRPAWVRSTVKFILAVAAAIAVFAVILPTVLWFFAWLANREDVFPEGPKGISIFGALTAAATGLGGLFTATKDRVTKVRPDGGKAGRFSGASSIVTQTGAGWAQTLVVWLVLTLVAFFGLALLSWAAVYAGDWSGWWRWGLAALLLFSALAVDQTTFSLHPFYRQRLAGAFAVRRAVLRDGSVGALPYDYNAEQTKLSTHGRRVEGDRGTFPQTIFVASAALSLRNRTAPGRPAVPFTFSHDYVGGPDTGWVRTTTMEDTAPPLVGRDLTVQSAVAVSGAAFASAMGTQSMAAQRLLALSNLRLGTWVPNPLYLAEVALRGPDWVMPRLPRVRRLRYQLQELIGRYSDSSPMLLCTDGGHFDNLGLVELLRLRCRTVYVIDSSGDSPPLATTLAQAVTLAYEDLGVQITFDQKEVLKLVPGSAEKLEPTEPMAALNTRFSANCLVKGVIKYPEDVEFEEGKPGSRCGTIIFAKASLTPDMPYELLSYALKEKAFPRQSTMDQWFDHTQFDAYRELGYHLGAAAVWPAPVKRRRLFDRADRPPAAPPRSV